MIEWIQSNRLLSVAASHTPHSDDDEARSIVNVESTVIEHDTVPVVRKAWSSLFKAILSSQSLTLDAWLYSRTLRLIS
jgi:hypothetical protein